MTGGMTTCCGGIVGWSSSTSRINNCLQIGDIQVSTEGSNTFSRNSGNAVIVNSYYLNGFGAVEGTAIQTNEAQMASGELCYLLNEGSTILPILFLIEIIRWLQRTRMVLTLIQKVLI